MHLKLMDRVRLPGIRTGAGLVLFGGSFLVFLATLAPGVYGFDSAELATGVYTQGIVHPPGYPGYLLLGKLFTWLLPARDIAFRLNVMSALFASLTVLLLFLAIDNILDAPLPAAAAGFFLGISNYFWQMALITEVYTTFTAFLAADLLVVTLWHKHGRPGSLLLFSLLFGLTLTVHTSAILFAPAFAWLILRGPSWTKSHWYWVPVMFGLFAAALCLPYAYLALRAATHPPLDYSQIYPQADLRTLSGLWWFFSGRAYTIFAFAYSLKEVPAEAWHFAGYLWRNYMGAGVLLGLAGIPILWRARRDWAIGLLAMFLANASFYINYRVLDKDTMFLPAYEVWAFFIAAGMVGLGRMLLRWHLPWGLSPQRGSLALALCAVVLCTGAALNWGWVDMSHADGYEQFAEEMMADTAPNSTVIAPWSSAVVLEYYQVVEGRRPDLVIRNRSRYDVARYYELLQQGMHREQILDQIQAEEVSYIHQQIKARPVYAVEYDPVLATQFEYLPDGRVFRLAVP